MTQPTATMGRILLIGCCLGFGGGVASAQDIFNAVESGNVVVARTLLARDAGLIKAKDKYGNNLLRLATLRGDLAMAETLVAAGADVNEVRTDDGSTALHVAAGVGALDIVKLVVAHGAVVDARDARGRTALLDAVSGRRKEVAEYLLAHGALLDINAVNPDAFLRNTLAAGLADLSRRVMRERTVLYTARDGLDQTLLHFAARGGVAELVRELTGKGISPNAVDLFGWTPMHVAAANGHAAVVDALAAAGADKNARTAGGLSAWNLAERAGQGEMVARLRVLGVDRGPRIFPALRTSYVDPVLPTVSARLFAPDIVSDRAAFEHSPVAFSDDLRFLAWSVGNRTDISTIFLMERRDGRWTAPSPFRAGASHPAFSHDGRRLFYTAARTMPDGSKAGDEDIFYAERTAEGWGAPVNLGPGVNTEQDDSSPSLAADDTLFFEHDGEIFCSRPVKGRYGSKQKVMVGGPAIMPWVSSDGSFLVFKGIGAAAPARMAFRRADGTWTPGVDIPDTIRTRGTVFPSVTPDGKFLFVATGDFLWTALPENLVADLRARATK